MPDSELMKRVVQVPALEKDSFKLTESVAIATVSSSRSEINGNVPLT